MHKLKFEINVATKNQLREIKSLLKKLDLVYEDVDKHVDNFIVVLENKQIMGCAGFEKYDEVGLLRSVAVNPKHQGKGIGHKLIEEINANAKKREIKDFYLLTDSASQFFLKFGFEEVSRVNVDERIKKTYEYSEACPDSAIVMKKIL
ncbi:MAG: arsenic resistance N-acetyltransferase ArsN2 [Candidatus Heimdallarchaeaceae archaeon]